MAHAGIEVLREIFGNDRDRVPLEQRRADLAELAGSPPAPPGITVEHVTLAERPAERLIPPFAAKDAVVLYLHGGGYCTGSLDTHRGVAGSLALEAGATVTTLDYRLAPEDPFPAALNDALLAFDQLAPARVAIAGDSAGGGLALATALALRDRGGAQPAALVLFSPWTDLTGTSESTTTKADEDPMVDKDVLLQMAEAYLAGADPKTPLASPLFADLTGLPPMHIDVGDAEILLDDSTTLADRARAAGVRVDVRTWPEMIHVFQAFPPDLIPEAAESLLAAGEFLAARLAADPETKAQAE